MPVDKWKDRTRALIGSDNLKRLEGSRGLVLGLGGVGGQAAEALARIGLGTLDLVDMDTIDETNINRQVIALASNVGQSKVDLMRERVRAINPAIQGQDFFMAYGEETSGLLDLASYDLVLDAIDDVPAKVLLAQEAQETGVLFISSMGAGMRLDPTQIRLGTIYKTTVCPLARKIRKEVRALGLDDYPVVYSTERPVKSSQAPAGVLASSSFVPPAAGLAMVSFVVRELISMEGLIR